MFTPHGAKNWWQQTVAGERMYNTPSNLKPFFSPRPGSGLGQTPSGGADVDQVKLLAELESQVFATLASAQDLLRQVAKYDPAREKPLAQELANFFVVANSLESQISQMTLPAKASEVQEFTGDIEVLATDVRGFRDRVSETLRSSIEASQKRTAFFAIVVGAASIGIGWYVWRKRRR